MSSISDSVKSRFGFGFQDRPTSSESSTQVPTTPNIPKSASRENLIQSHLSASAPHNDTFELHEDPSFWKDHNVQVIIRVRPLSNSELSTQGYNKCVRQESVQTITWTGHPESRFTFDAIADENVSQEKLFKVAGVPMVENCVGGYNSCMFAYGQTGSGKTHTMLGDIEGGTRRHSVNCGMTPRVFEYLFQRIQKEKEARREEKLRFTCKCSFLEIYNEQILDLLDPSSSNLQIREDLKKGVYVENLKEIEVATARDVVLQLLQGAANRKVAATNMNLASSRSHSVFTCIIESKWESQGVTHHRFARLNLVDLAGSERQKSSGAEGERLKEATNINKSLSTLGLVIMNLVSISNGKSLHVPYRDSKLTFLLQDSLGGNSKTIIIANISPSICCSLETLSTLKFAQRAKFIKNNAIVNEDTSGDVLAMRLQIQQLKKEVSHLRELTNGGAGNPGNDTGSMSFPGSPGSLSWDGLHASFSPFTTTKRTSNKKEFEAALVGAFRREKDKEISFQALSSEHKAALQLAKQREDEIKSLKMRLRFRESAIKRLEGLASGKISAETHLLKEKEEYLKEIEVLRSQVDKNQEVTRFAMENLRLKEEIRRLKSFYEEGEREMMKEQITVLQNKLLEALDWKLMHESDSSSVQKGYLDVPPQSPANDFLVSGQEPGSPWLKSNDEENEFLRMQAIQNQAEIDTLRKKLNICLEDKEKLERRLSDLEKELEQPRSYRGSIEESEKSELKTMVDAISAASQREAEAHETAIFLSKENEELRTKIKVLIEDNNKLIELYEWATTETKSENKEKGKVAEDNDTEHHHANGGTAHLEHQLEDLQEENEKLMGLYEKAMQERDEFKRMLSFREHSRYETRGEFDCPEKLVEMDRKECVQTHGSTVSLDDRQHLASSVQEISNGGSNMPENTSLFVNDMPVQEKAQVHYQENGATALDGSRSLVETSVYGSTISYEGKMFNEEGSDGSIMNTEDANPAESTNEIDEEGNSEMDIDPSDVHVAKMSEDVNLARLKLDTAHEKLLNSAKTMIAFSALEKAYAEADNLFGEIEAMEHNVQAKQQEIKSFKTFCSEIQEKRTLFDKKLLALEHSLSKFSTSVPYFEQRGDNARTKVDSSLSYLNQKKEELARLETVRGKTKAELMQLKQSEVELRNSLACLKPKLEEEKRSHDNDDKVLFPIDNIDNVNNSLPHRSCLSGKATELLKSEERLVIIRRETEALNRKLAKTDKERENVETEIQKCSKSLKESEMKLSSAVSEQKLLLEMIENVKIEFENVIIEYQDCIFKQLLKESELKIMEEELCNDFRRVEELRTAREVASAKKKQLLEEATCGCYSNCLSEKLEEEIQKVQVAVREARILLNVGPIDN